MDENLLYVIKYLYIMTGSNYHLDGIYSLQFKPQYSLTVYSDFGWRYLYCNDIHFNLNYRTDLWKIDMFYTN